MRQSRRTPALAQRPSGQASQEAFARAGGGGSGARQPRTAQPPPPVPSGSPSRGSPGWLHLCRLQRSPPLRKTLRGRGLLPQPRNPASLAPGRSGFSSQTPLSRVSPAPSAICPRRRTGATRRLTPLCASKDDEVVEYALSRTLSPTLIAEYQTQLPDKKLLRAKLHKFYLQNAPEEVSDRPSADSKHRIRKKVL